MTQCNTCLGTRPITLQSKDGAQINAFLVLSSSSSASSSSSSSSPKEDTRGNNDDRETKTDDTSNAVNNEPSWSSLNMTITDGNATFSTTTSSFNLSKIKMTKEQLQHKHPIIWFVDTILQSTPQDPTLDDKDMKDAVRFVFSIMDNGSKCIRLDVKYTFENIVRVVLSVDIPRVSSSSLFFVRQLSDFVSESLLTVQTLQRQVEHVEKERNEWKETAQKLCQEHWQCEREELFKRFLVLLNNVKGDVKIANEKVNEEKQRYNVLLEQYKRQEQLLKRHGGKSGGGDDDDLVIDYEDEHDGVNLPEDEVERLAKGIRVDGHGSSSSLFPMKHKQQRVVEQGARKKIKVTTTQNDNDERNGTNYIHGVDVDNVCGGKDKTPIIASTDTVTTAANVDVDAGNRRSNKMCTRKNPLTGSLEIWNIEDMFSDTSSVED